VNKGGLAIIPSFAVGRTQEVLITLAKGNFEVWLDGMGKTVNGIMLDQPNYLADHRLLEEADGKVKIVHSQHGRNLAAKGEVIVTTSGMLDGGPVLDYLRRIKDDPKSAVLLTGYQVQGTNGRMLLDFGLVDFAGVTEKVNCKVEFFDFSAHAGHSQLKEFIKKCEPEKVILCHSDNRQALVDDLKDRFEFLTPNTGEVVNI
jgi:putative mRNA 3-end processing factor